MRPDARKIGIVASTEFGSSIRTRSFFISLLLMPILMGLSIGLQSYVSRRVDTRPRAFAVVDRTGALYPAIERAAEAYNKEAVDPEGRAVRPRLEPSRVDDGADVERDLSDRIRRGRLDAFVVIPAGLFGVSGPVIDLPPPTIAYHSDTPNDRVIPTWITATINAEVRARRFQAAGIDQALADRLNRPVGLDNLGLVEGSGTGEKVDPVRTAGVPAALLFVMFLLVWSTTPQLLNSVIEEKMSKISEVLLGSVTPFELMMGKLLGNAAIASVLAALYISGGYGVAWYYGYADAISPGLMVAMAAYLMLAILLYGSLFMAVGSACNDLKDAQSMMLPVMLLGMLPMFVWTAVLNDPSSTLSVGLSLFPPASPYLMLMRMAMRPSPPAWQVGLSIVGTALTALVCVWAAAKIFRVGLLMQGKAPSYRELARWVMAR